MAIYEILVIDTNKFKTQVEAETPEQALERAERLGLTDDFLVRRRHQILRRRNM